MRMFDRPTWRASEEPCHTILLKAHPAESMYVAPHLSASLAEFDSA